MRLKDLNEKRKKYLRGLASLVKSEYLDRKGFDLGDISKDMDITFINTGKLREEKTFKIDGKYYVVLPERLLDDVKNYEIAHGIGHAFLNHLESKNTELDEAEADYLAENVTNVPGIEYQYLINLELILYRMIHPFKAFKRYLVNDRFDELFREKEVCLDEVLNLLQ